MIEQPFPPKLCRDREELAHSYLARKRYHKPAISTGALSVALIFLFGLGCAALLAWILGT